MPEFITDDGVRLTYRVEGDGPTATIWLHGMCGATGYWTELWGEMGSCRRNIALDFRGHGRSEPEPTEFTNERLARDVLLLADTLGLGRFVLAGHSFGGKIALLCATLAPERVAAVILLGAVGPGLVPLPREGIEPVLVRSAEAGFIRESFRPWFAVWPRAEIDAALENFSRTPEWALRAVCEIALWTDLSARIGRLRLPALIVAGTHDPIYGPAYQREAVAPALHEPQFAVVESGHGIFLECPTEVARACSQFLLSLEEPR